MNVPRKALRYALRPAAEAAADYDADRFAAHRLASLFMTLIAAVAGTSLWLWDYVHDPLGAEETLWLRLAALPSALPYLATLAFGADRRLAYAAALFTLVGWEAGFLEILDRIENGPTYGVAALMYFIILPLLMTRGFSLLLNTWLIVALLAVPLVWYEAGFVSGFEPAKYIVLLFPAALLTLSALFAFSRLYRRNWEQALALRQRADGIAHVREREFRALVENSPDFIARFDPAGRFLYANPMLANLVGAPLDRLLGRQPTEIVPQPPGAAEVVRAVVDTARTGIARETELDLRGVEGADRHPVVHHVRLVPEVDRFGAVGSVLVVGRDVSAMKDAEHRLKISHAELRELTTRRETAREEERKRIAREIHDELGHYLTALRMGVSTLRVRFGDHHPGLGGCVQELMALADNTLHAARSLAASLHPAELDLGLAPALEWLAGEFVRQTGTRCRLQAPGEGIVLDAERAVAAFRVVQESLTNIARHAAATEVDIVLRRDGQNYLLEVRDNGRGFDPARRRKDTLGLVGVRERAVMIGGELAIASSPGAGTTIRLAIPAPPILENE